METQFKTELFAHYVRPGVLNVLDRQPVREGWSVACKDIVGVPGLFLKNPATREQLIFGSEQDARLAVAALAEAGIVTREHALKMDRSEFVRICCEALMW